MTTVPQKKQATKAQIRLEIRRAAYSQMISDIKKNYSGYHRPGSNKK